MLKQEVFQKLIDNEKATKQRLFYSAVFLFSNKGYSNVGIRELCKSVNIKESSFYNHYSGKEELFNIILNYFSESNRKIAFNDEEIEKMVNAGDIRFFLYENMKKFSSITGDPIYHTILQIVQMEKFSNKTAYLLAKNNLYRLRKEYTEKVIKGLMEKGCIKECNIQLVTTEYYYCLEGMLDEYLLHEVWNEKTDEINNKIIQHIEFFANMLKK